MRELLPLPVFKSTSLLRRACEKLPAPLDQSGTLFFAFARAALAAGLGMLGLKPGDNVFAPSFVPTVAVAPLNELSGSRTPTTNGYWNSPDAGVAWPCASTTFRPGFRSDFTAKIAANTSASPRGVSH